MSAYTGYQFEWVSLHRHVHRMWTLITLMDEGLCLFLRWARAGEGLAKGTFIYLYTYGACVYNDQTDMLMIIVDIT